MNLETTSRIIVEGEKIQLHDIRESECSYIENNSIYGSPKTTILQDGGYPDTDGWEKAPSLKNGDEVRFEGETFTLIVRYLKFSDAIFFIRKSDIEYIKKAIA